MTIISPGSVTTVNHTNSGDLIRYQMPSGVAVTAIVLIAENESRVIGVLNPEAVNEPAPFHMALQGERRCLALNPGWLIELVLQNDTVAGPRRFANSGGAIHVGSNGVVMNFDALKEDFQHSELTINLETWAMDEVAQGSAAFSNWKIWLSDEDRLNPQKEPLLQYSALPAS